MAGVVDSVLDGVDTFLAWISTGLKQTMQSYCGLQTADSEHVLVGNDGALVSVIRIDGVNALVGDEEYKAIHDGVLVSLENLMSREGYTIQVVYGYNRDQTRQHLVKNFRPSEETCARLDVDLNDLFEERLDVLTDYTVIEDIHIVLWTRPNSLSSEQLRRANADKIKTLKEENMPQFQYTQNVVAAMPELRDAHDSFLRSLSSDFISLGIKSKILDVHEACHAIRMSVDPEFTDDAWRPVLPGDKIRPKIARHFRGDVSDVLWPSLGHQLMPRDGEVVDLKVAKLGNRIYSCVYIDLFPKEIQSFSSLLSRTIPTHIPWRMSFLIDGGGLNSLKMKRILASLLSFSSAQNRLINDAVNLLDYIELNSDDAVVRFRVVATTWAPEDDLPLLRTRSAQLARAIEGWGSCDVSEMCGDSFEGLVSTMVGVSSSSPATSTVASFSDVLYMLPIYRPTSPWKTGALMFRTPDGKPMPYQPGSSSQTTWIDLIYARPGSGKSVLSNALNLALCLAPGIQRLPRVSIIDIGPSSSGLISLLQEGMPKDKRHLVAYHRLRMSKEYSINPFDTQLGSRVPLPQERSFLVNFITLLSTPMGADTPYDGVPDMVGLVVDEAYKQLSDKGNPNIYTAGVDDMIDAVLTEIHFVADNHTTWWEVTDALFTAGFFHEAMLAQRYAVPLISDLTSVSRSTTVEDLYSKVVAPTGEPLIDAFNRMISSAIREYPIISNVTKFDIGDARIVSLDLDEVAKSGGTAADRQTAVMYMLARYVLAKDFYLNRESISSFNKTYHQYHERRVTELQDDPKRLVMDEFHRTAKTRSVRDQVIVDMREGRKWNVQIALISQSLDDFDSVMVEFGTSIFIMDAGPEQAIQKTTKIFGLSDTAQKSLRLHVRGPREGGATFLAQFATKYGNNTQLLTLTLGPIELWAFSTTSEDANLRNKLYFAIGPEEARRVLASLFPSGSAKSWMTKELEKTKLDKGFVDDEMRQGVVDKLAKLILEEYKKNPNFKALVS